MNNSWMGLARQMQAGINECNQTQIRYNNYINSEWNKMNLQCNNERKISIIETSMKKQSNYYETVRGKRSETKELNIHIKTINQKFLKRCALVNVIEKTDREALAAYKKMKANFSSSQFLFSALQLETKNMYRNYYRSSCLAKDVLSSDRMFFMNKIITMKFMKKIEAGVDRPNNSWKQEYFKNRKSQPNRSLTP